MKIRSRPFLFLLLSLALLFAQQGAAMHRLSHQAEPFANSSQQDKQLPHSPACDKCVVYAGVGGAVAASKLIIPSVTVHVLPVAAIQPALLSQPARPYQARAPPSLV